MIGYIVEDADGGLVEGANNQFAIFGPYETNLEEKILLSIKIERLTHPNLVYTVFNEFGVVDDPEPGYSDI